ncbi:MAG: thioredoxin family protein [Mycoplasmoidaceae bacterium]
MPKKIITNSNLNEIENSKNLTILKFSAEWCGPCQMFVPVYAEASSKYSDLLFGEIDIDDEETKAIVSKYNVNTVPTTIFFKDGKEVERFLGYKDISKFEEMIIKHK